MSQTLNLTPVNSEHGRFNNILIYESIANLKQQE